MSRAERRKKMREEKEARWMEKMKQRGGLVPKRAKHWGDPCSHPECEQCEDGECAYPDFDEKGCYQLKGKKENAS